MKAYRVFFAFMTACVLLVVSPLLTARGTSDVAVGSDLSAALRGALVQAHNARASAAAPR
jgi:hypothetical protein